jgi:hypothetical protein
MPESLIARVLAYADAKQLAIIRRSPTWLRKPSANLLPSHALRVAVVAVGSLLVERDEPVLGHRGSRHVSCSSTAANSSASLGVERSGTRACR